MATISRPPRPSSMPGRPPNPISPPTSLQMPAGIPSDTFDDVAASPSSSPLPVARRKRSNSLQARKKKHLSASFSHINTNGSRSSSGNSIRSLSPFRRRPSKSNSESNVQNRSSWEDDQLLITGRGNSGWESAPIEADEMVGMVIPPPAASPQVTSNETTRDAIVQTASRESESTSSTPVSEYAGEESLPPRGRRSNSRSRNLFSRSSNSDERHSTRSRSPFMERVFGDNIPSSQRVFPQKSNLPTSLPPINNRTTYPMNVFHNPATDFWIATVNVGTRSSGTTSSKHLRAFSYPSEIEAKEGSLAYAPPIMLPFQSNPNCFLCHGKFALLRRAKHCRSCGVCVCSSCSITWPSKMIPDTFNIKHEKQVNICKSCNWLSNAFREALLNGDEAQVKALYATGNINLRSPFANQKNDEIMFPIHCATKGGNLSLLKWLIEDKCCPIRLLRTGNNQKQIENPIRTSQGRSVLQIAMEECHVHLIQYFIIKQQIPINEMKDLKTILTAFHAVIRSLPDTSNVESSTTSTPAVASAPTQHQVTGEATTQTQHSDYAQITPPPREYIDIDKILKRNKKRFIHGLKQTISPTKNTSTLLSTSNNPYYNNNNNHSYDDDDDSDTMTVTSVQDACILCYEKSIDCVITPCGHQICCMECSTCLENTCPVCQQRGTFIKIYKP